MKNHFGGYPDGLSDEIREWRVEDLETGPWQTRRIDDADLTDLVDSIRQVGVLQPILIWHRPDDALVMTPAPIIAGHRRFRAACVVGLSTVPVRVVTCSEADARAICVIENLQRRDLDPIEEARGFRVLVDGGMKQTEVGARIGCSQERVSNALRLLRLPESVLGLISCGKLSASHGRALLAIGDAPAEVYECAAQRAVKRGATVTDLEHMPLCEDACKSLVDKGIVRIVHPWGDTAWWMSHCNDCKRRSSYVCLDVTCYAQRQAEQVDKLGAESETVRQVLAGSGVEPLTVQFSGLQELRNQGMLEIHREECPEDCECRRQVVLDGRTVTLCADRNRLMKCREARDKAEKAAVVHEHAQITEALEAEIAANGGALSSDARCRLISWLVAGALVGYDEMPVARKLAAKAPDMPACAAVLAMPQYGGQRSTLAAALRPTIAAANGGLELLARVWCQTALAPGYLRRECMDWVLSGVAELCTANQATSVDIAVCLRCDAEFPLPAEDAHMSDGAVMLAPEVYRLADGAVVVGDDVYYCQECGPNVHVCAKCGCTDELACPGGCSWVSETLCSACSEEERDADASAGGSDDGADGASDGNAVAGGCVADTTEGAQADALAVPDVAFEELSAPSGEEEVAAEVDAGEPAAWTPEPVAAGVCVSCGMVPAIEGTYLCADCGPEPYVDTDEAEAEARAALEQMLKMVEEAANRSEHSTWNTEQRLAWARSLRYGDRVRSRKLPDRVGTVGAGSDIVKNGRAVDRHFEVTFDGDPEVFDLTSAEAAEMLEPAGEAE